MRLKANLNMSTDWLVKDYRSIFMALIKSVFMKYDSALYSNLYGTDEQPKKVNKPFTFSVRFPKYGGIEGNRILCGNNVFFLFSSNDETLVTAFYNGLQKQRKIIIGNNHPITFETDQIQLLPFRKIHSEKVLFRTISPILVNNKGNNLDYLSPINHEFPKAFKEIISIQANNFRIRCSEQMIKFDIKEMKKLPLTHYNQTMTSWLGEFVLEAPVDVLQLIYDTGIGVRRSQGFGMLDIKKQY